VLLAATGRHPLTATLNLDSVSVNTKKGGFVEVSMCICVVCSVS